MADSSTKDIVDALSSQLTIGQITMDGNMQIEWLRMGHSQTDISKECSFKATIADPLASSFVVEYHPRVLKALGDGPAFSYLDQSYIRNSSGVQLYTLRLPNGRVDATIKNSSTFESDAGIFPLGYFFNVLLYRPFQKDSLLSILSSVNTQIVSRVEQNGKVTLKLHQNHTPDNLIAEVILDRAFNYALVGAKYDARDGISVVINNSDFALCGSGPLYLPHKSTVVTNNAMGRITTTVTLKTVTVTPISKENLVKLSLAPGTVVYDDRLNISYILGKSPDKVLDDINTRVKDIQTNN